MASIDRAGWKAFADRFTKEHDGWSASVEVRHVDGGIEMAVEDRPFRGVTVERRDDRESLILAFGDDADEHLAHIVDGPRDLATIDVGPEHHSLVIALADGTGCLVELTNPFTAD